MHVTHGKCDETLPLVFNVKCYLQIVISDYSSFKIHRAWSRWNILLTAQLKYLVFPNIP